MGTVVSFAAVPRTKGWTDQEKAEIFRAAGMLAARGLPFDTASGVSDAGDPWFVLTGRDTGEVLVHFARIDGQFVAHYTSANVLLRGREFRELIDRVLFGPTPAAQRTAAETLSSSGVTAVLAYILVQQVEAAVAAVREELEGEAAAQIVEGGPAAQAAPRAEIAGHDAPAAPQQPDAPASVETARAEEARAPEPAAKAPSSGGGSAPTIHYDAGAIGPALVKAAVSASPNVTVIRGTSGNDSLTGTNGDDIIFGGAGNDTISALAGNDTVDAGAGDDVVAAGEGADLVAAGLGDDRVDGGAGSDTILGGFGDDTLDGGAGNDTVAGGAGNDLARAAAGNDLVIGGAGADTISGGQGHDLLVAGTGNDTVVIGQGSDIAIGGLGADTFVVLQTAAQDGTVTGTEFAQLVRSLTAGKVEIAPSVDWQAFLARGSLTSNLIADFSQSQGDKLGLGSVSDVGTFTAAATPGSFEFISAFPFSGDGSRQLRVVIANGTTTIQADIDGDGKADFAVELLGVVKITQSDFVG
ncbi:MAG TPA: hypothetical protein VED40_05425 [Azospirillaceae bacterium]|nr:hypothetical protein [Azospirillaceae bacterium]